MNNNIKGILGAIIGAIIFSLPWVMIYIYGNYIVAIMAAVIAYGALLLYKKFGGIVDKKTPLIITISSLLAITIATFIIIPIWLIIKEGYSFQLEMLREIYQDSSFVKSIIWDYVISIVFTLLGISGVISNINKEVYMNSKDKNDTLIDKDDYIDKLDIDKQVRYVEDIYKKYDGYDKDRAIPISLVINDMNRAINKNGIINQMIKKGVVVLTGNKSYFDKEALVDSDRGRNNYKKSSRVSFFKGIVIGLLIIGVIIFVITLTYEEDDNDYNDNKNNYEEIPLKIYNYKDIYITLPESFSLSDMGDNYKYYYDYGYGVIEEVMLEQSEYSEDNEEGTTITEYLDSIKEKYNLSEIRKTKIDGIDTVNYMMNSKEYTNEYYEVYMSYGEDYVYMIMFYKTIEDDQEKDENISLFRSTCQKYMNTVKYGNDKIVKG